MIVAKERRSLLTPRLTGWRMAGAGGFAEKDECIESFGGPGILWYTEAEYGDFVLNVRWRLTHGDDNSGVFLRLPRPDASLQQVIDSGYEVQIDDRGLDPTTGRLNSPYHLTGAIYGLAPAIANASGPVGTWNDFEIAAQGPGISVTLNDIPVAKLERGERRACGYIGLQAHHDGSAVQVQRCEIRVL